MDLSGRAERQCVRPPLALPQVSNSLYYFLGAATQVLKKIRQTLRPGYFSSRGFSLADYDRSIEYDLSVFKRWFECLEEYQQCSVSVKNSSILELGPGMELGTGLIFLWKGAFSYTAVDVNPLVHSVPLEFYERLVNHLSLHLNGEKNIEVMRGIINSGFNGLKERPRGTEAQRHKGTEAQYHKGGEGRGSSRFNYIVDREMSFSDFDSDSIDLVFSNAAFEHFSSIEKIFNRLNRVVKAGGIMIAEVDLKTHHPWIKKRDPLNIYRYSESFYRLFKYSGSPNRKRPYEYKELLERNGWSSVRIYPNQLLGQNYLSGAMPGLNRHFHDSRNQMEYSSIMFCATKQ